MIGDSNLKYNYFNKNVFNNKINYSYSKFGGLNFLISWQDRRNECSNILNNWNDDYEGSRDVSETNIELKKWLSSDVVFSELEKVHLLIKRFEVTKRIYEKYDEEYRRVNKFVNYENLNLYINFGFLMVRLYDEFKHLQYLNSLLKVVDILCSRVFEFENSCMDLPKYAIVELLKAEKRIIVELCKDNNIKI
jgi:hypothetical protein